MAKLMTQAAMERLARLEAAHVGTLAPSRDDQPPPPLQLPLPVPSLKAQQHEQQEQQRVVQQPQTVRRPVPIRVPAQSCSIGLPPRPAGAPPAHDTEPAARQLLSCKWSLERLRGAHKWHRNGRLVQQMRMRLQAARGKPPYRGDTIVAALLYLRYVDSAAEAAVMIASLLHSGLLRCTAASPRAGYDRWASTALKRSSR